ncbi:DUF697 domain-containing protein [Chroococcidiopsis sp [FACHB-1243]]|uniref:slr1306 family protein n=1 Tax=Chroococcidiopsis sp. [FACHB-1243] TaxID=2692781 RepID=UPI0018F02DAF|nr:DUF697 domain-containing protein [Chroococcidiopsis sp. [FACHB-1243]]
MLQRPILIGGVGLAFALWFLQGWRESLAHLGEFSLMGAIAIILCLWLFGKYRPKQRVQELPINRETVEKAIAQVQVVADRLEIENHPTPELREKIAQLEAQIDRQEINLAITGGKSVGKTTLRQVLEAQPQDRKLCISETAALFSEVEQTDTAALQSAIASDLILFVTAGDLTDSEYQTLQQLLAAHQRPVLVFNKQDQYLPEDRAAVLYSLQQKIQPTLTAEDVVAIASAPNSLKVRQHQTDGAVEEWLEQRLPEIASLTQRLEYILQQEAQQLVWATIKRQAEELKAEGKVILDGIRRDRALPVVEQYQWIAAAAAFANPVPALDLLATAAINAQLVMELGAVYQQKFSFEQAQNVAGTMGSLMLKLGLVELSTKAISTVLKTNAITFVAGGAVQGVSAAYLTRLAGCSLIEYFQQQEEAIESASGLNLDKLRQTLQNVFQQNQQVAFLQGFVKQGLGRLLPAPQPQA